MMETVTEKIVIHLTRSEASALTALLTEAGKVLLANEIQQAIVRFDTGKPCDHTDIYGSTSDYPHCPYCGMRQW